MKKTKKFRKVQFSADVLREASDALRIVVGEKNEIVGEDYEILTISFDDIKWSHDNVDEFVSDYRKNHKESSFWFRIRTKDGEKINYSSVDVSFFNLGNFFPETHVSI